MTQQRIEELEESLLQFIDVNREDCRWDHHGGCQEHADLTGDGKCYVKDAKALIPDWKERI